MTDRERLEEIIDHVEYEVDDLDRYLIESMLGKDAVFVCNSLRDILDAAKKKNVAEVVAMLEALPLTMDKVRWVPRMELFYIYDPHHGLAAWVDRAQPRTDPRFCWSTREAAEGEIAKAIEAQATRETAKTDDVSSD